VDRQPGHDTRTVRLAMLQARAEPLALTENLALVDASALEARQAGADLLLTPELFATGYAPTLIAESVSAASVRGAHEPLRAIAANRGIALAFSLPGPGPADEREITATLVDAGSASGIVYADLSIPDLSIPDVDVDYLADRRPGLYRAWEQNRTTEET